MGSDMLSDLALVLGLASMGLFVVRMGRVYIDETFRPRVLVWLGLSIALLTLSAMTSPDGLSFHSAMQSIVGLISRFL